MSEDSDQTRPLLFGPEESERLPLLWLPLLLITGLDQVRPAQYY